MYKIINITDKYGNVKFKEIEDIKKNYSTNMTGEILNPEFMKENTSFCFLWNGNHSPFSKFMRTSPIEKIDEKDNILCITTRNTIYFLQKI